MSYPRLLLSALLVTALSTAALAQEGRVIVANNSSKEPKRTAHRMRIPVEQLKNVRSALQEATDLAIRVDPAPSQEFQMLGHFWIQFNRPKAASAIESMYADMRATAQKAETLAGYQQLSASAQMLLGALGQLDSERALQLVRDWPDPSASMGDNAEKVRHSLDDNLRAQMIQQLQFRDPERAMALLSQAGPNGPPNYGARAQIAQRMISAGNPEEGFKLIDQAIADFAQNSADPRAIGDYLNFVQQLAYVDPDRFLKALNQLPQVPPSAASAPQPLRIGDQTLQLTFQESAVFNILRGGLAGRPELLLKTLNMVPDLKTKLDQLGGIDNVLFPRTPVGGWNSISSSSGTKPQVYKVDLASLFEELRGKAEKNPTFVRRKLSEAVTGPDQADGLINLANRASGEDPELASLALELARQLVMRVEPLYRRSYTLEMLVSAYRNCDGEVDSALLREGFILADQLRDEEQNSNPNPSRGNMASRADQLEALLVSEYARDDLEGARRYLRSLPDDLYKLQILTRMVQALAQP